MVECFENIDKAKRRVRNAPKGQKRLHVPSTVDGHLVPLMLDMNNWKTVNWSEKAREYQMGGKGEVSQHLCTRLVIFITRL